MKPSEINGVEYAIREEPIIRKLIQRLYEEGYINNPTYISAIKELDERERQRRNNFHN